MKSKFLLGMVVSGLALFLWTEAAQAQGRWGGGRGGWGGNNYGGYGRGYNYGYSPFNYNYGYTVPNYNSYYNTPSYYNSNGYYGYRQGYNNYPGTSYYTDNPDYGYTQSATPGNYQSFYSGAGNDRVRLHVVVPSPDARLWVENTPTQGTGWERNFDSPPLTPGQVYTYTLRASWFAGGREVSQEKQVDVRPGEAVTVRFDTSTASATP